MIGEASLGAFGIREEAGRFHDHFHTQLFPGQFGRLALLEHLDGLAVDDELTFAGLDLSVELAVHAVILEQGRQMLGLGQVVDGHDIELLGPIQHSAENKTADAAKTVDAHFNCHRSNSLHCNSPIRPRYEEIAVVRLAP